MTMYRPAVLAIGPWGCPNFNGLCFGPSTQRWLAAASCTSSASTARLSLAAEYWYWRYSICSSSRPLGVFGLVGCLGVTGRLFACMTASDDAADAISTTGC